MRASEAPSAGTKEVVRSFVALPCPEGVRRALADASARWREIPADVRWTAPERIHVTLRFLGDATRLQLEVMDAALARRAAAAAPIVARSGRTGAFPDWRHPRVLWLGLDDDGGTARLAAEIDQDARAAGFHPETRPFTPHLTIGRV
ncbi:MAG: RNA 2',3'-cyclic phosphodiesterase, partial [Gemmatimonadota bacterium]